MYNNEDDDDDEGLESDDDAELLSWVKNCIGEGKTARNRWLTSAKEDYEFEAGRQWDAKDAKDLDTDGRPVVTFNRIVRVLNAITGLEIQNRQEVVYIPREISDGPFNRMLTDTAAYVRECCDAEDEESEAFRDAAICGEGWTNTIPVYDEDPDGEVHINRTDPLNMIVDPNATKKNYSDARWVCCVQRMTKRAVKEEWPDATLSIGSKSLWMDDDIATETLTTENNKNLGAITKTKYVDVFEFQYFKREPAYSVAANDPNGQPQGSKLLNEEDFDAFKKNADALGVQYEYAKVSIKKYHKLFFCNDEILEHTPLAVGKFTFNAITCFRDNNSGYFFGIVSIMKDPQRWANKWLSQIIHIINSGAKGGYFHEEGAIADPERFEEDGARPGSNTEVTAGALVEGRIQPKATPDYPQGVDRLLQYALESINDVPGINVEMLGSDNKDIPVAVALQRKAAGITILAPLFDALRRYRKNQGRILAVYIQKFMPDGKLVKIAGPTGPQYIPYRREKNVMYDVIIDDAPTSANMRTQVFAVISQMIPVLLQAGIAIPPEVLDYMPLPSGLISSWKELIMKGKPQDPVAEQLKQINLILAQLEIGEKQAVTAEIQSKTQLNMAKANESMAVSQDEQAQAYQKMHGHQVDIQMNQQAMIAENIRKDVESLMKIRRQDAEAQAKIKRGNTNDN